MKNILLVSVCLLIVNTVIFSQKDEHDITSISLDSLLNIKISSASKYWQKTFEAPSAVSIISSEDIEKFGYQTLGEALSSLCGFYFSYDRNYSYTGVRGFSRPTDYNNRILLLLNNHAMNENVFGSSSLGTDLGIPLSSIERIEVVRGPGSSLYGTGAMFAVINIITKSGKNFDKTSFSLGAGSLRDYTATFNYGSEISNDLEVFFSTEYFNRKGRNLFFKEFDDPSSNSGLAVDLDKDNYIGLLTKINYKRLQIQLKYSTREKYIPTAPYGISFNDKRTKTIDNISFAEISYTLPIDGTKQLTFLSSIDNYKYSGDYPYNSSVLYDAADGIWTNLNAQFDWEVSSSYHLITGIEYKGSIKSEYKTWDEAGEIFKTNTLSSVKSIYLQNEFQPLSNLSLMASVRYDDYSNKSALFSPRGAVVFNFLDNTTLKLIYGSSYRTPNTYELYYKDIPTNFKPNPYLTSEKITTLEFVAEQKLFNNFYGIFSLYNYKVNNLIDQNFDITDSSLQFINYSKVSTTGFEVDLNYHPSENIKTFFRYSYQYAIDNELKSNLSNSPKHLLRAGIVFPLLNTFYCAPELFYESSRLTVYGTKTREFLLMNFTLTTKTFLNYLKASLSIKNLFNITYEYPGGFEHTQHSIVQDPRSFFFKIQINY
ncbi:MAG: TonB-dependent receptor [Ignavibacteriaceae bacterium]|nr:TonB-dependent receptor [Ignavibacteriaceae bacterium]